jgi:hypothetical protein
MTWMQTAYGRVVDLARPEPDSIHIDDLALGLARTFRFGGHTLIDLPPYGVAQHSHLVESLMPPETNARGRLAALLHDAHEAYCGDITTPMKWALNPGAALAIDDMKRRLQDAIESAIGLPWGVRADLAARITEADFLALAIERRDLMSPSPMEWQGLPDPGPVGEPHARIDPLGIWASAAVWKNRLKMLIREAGVQPMRSFEP